MCLGCRFHDAIVRVALLIISSLPTTARGAIAVHVVDADAVRSSASAVDSHRLRFVSAAGVEVTLELDPCALDLSNPLADHAFAPMSADFVEDAISELRPTASPTLTVTVYCLPGLPTELQHSFCRGAEVFLAPGLAPVPANIVAYTAVHELGHAVQHLTMPQRRGAPWEEYVRLRGLTDTRLYDPDGLHRNRPQEVFAEDFRVLYGGPLANYSGTMENASLPLPQAVQGLDEWFERTLAGAARPSIEAFNAPNPFNPSTTITVVFASQAPQGGATVDVYDLRGRRVRTLHAMASGNQLLATWRGRDDAGQPVASGRYFYRLTVDGRAVGGSMLLVE